MTTLLGRFERVLQHLRPVPMRTHRHDSVDSSRHHHHVIITSSSSRVSATNHAAGEQQLGGVDKDLLAHHLDALERDGVTVIEGLYPREQVARWQRDFQEGWRPLQADIPSLQWETMRFKKPFLASKSFATGKVLYEGKRVADVGDGTEIIDMGRGRYDVYGRLLDPVRDVVREPPPLLAAIAEVLLQYGFSALGTLGALPTLLPERGSQDGDRGGIWHRDAYSMWDQEAVDLQLPWFYMTCILPLHDLAPGEGGTEFVLGSHRMNLSELGLTTAAEIEEWAARQPRMEAAIKAGSLCVFHGFTLHRGATIRAARSSGHRTRDVIYFGFHKLWYNPEPTDEYDLVRAKSCSENA